MIVNDLIKALYLSAFKGELSCHASSDSNVEECIKCLLENKKINEKEVKRRKINSDMDTELYDIPKNWKWVKLGLLCDVVRGLTFASSQKEKNENNILVLRGGNIDSQTEKILYDDNIYVDKNIPNDNQYLKTGDTLIVASSGTKTSVGKSAYIDKIDSNVSFGGFMMVVRPYSEIVHPKYISYNIKSYRNKIINGTNGFISNVTNEILNNLMIPLPPIEEQQRIVDKIEELFRKLDDIKPIEDSIQCIKKQISNEMNKSIILSSLKGELTIQKDDEDAQNIINNIEENTKKEVEVIKNNLPFSIPKNWKWIKFGDLVNFTIGKTPPRADITYWSDHEYNWISISDMVDGSYINDTKEYVSQKSFDEIYKTKICKKGTLIMSFKMSVGKCSILNIDAFHHEGIISIYPNTDDKYTEIIKQYLFKILPFMTKYGESKKAIKGTTLNSKSLDKLMIPLPPIEEQQRIVDKIEKLLPLCDDMYKIINM